MKYYTDWEEAAQHDKKYRAVSAPFKDYQTGRIVEIVKHKNQDPYIVYRGSAIPIRRATRDEVDRHGHKWKRFAE